MHPSLALSNVVIRASHGVGKKTTHSRPTVIIVTKRITGNILSRIERQRRDGQIYNYGSDYFKLGGSDECDESCCREGDAKGMISVLVRRDMHGLGDDKSWISMHPFISVSQFLRINSEVKL